MFKLLLGLSPQVIMLVFGLGGLLGGGGLALAGAKLWNDWVDNPGIIRTQEAICVARVETAAAKATRDEQYRQYQAGRASAEEFIRQQLENDAQWQSEIERVERENQIYRERLARENRSCPVTADDLDFITGVPNDRTP